MPHVPLLEPVAVHPRVCGERPKRSASPFAAVGSSPRVRGTRRPWCRSSNPRRFIPACAGNALIAGEGHFSLPVHPRVCGERFGLTFSDDSAGGSSPRVRGTRYSLRVGPDWRRFIPACAGNASIHARQSARCSVHPRVCGERNDTSTWTARHRGSSPRVRGTPRSGGRGEDVMRFIPACAGNASMNSSRNSISSVHPRVCGERRRTLSGSCNLLGSSPRVRGTLAAVLQKRLAIRFIPACAGNASQGSARLFISPVHPRVCGERFQHPQFGFAHAGSSPRVRGTLPPERPEPLPLRFIPACAGNALRGSH